MSTPPAPSIPEAHAGAVLTIDLDAIATNYRLLADRLDDVVVATDSEKVRSVVEAHGGNAVMTRSDHVNGTERIAEAAESLESEIVVNVFGDEALVMPDSIDAVVAALHDDASVNVGILVNPFTRRNSPGDIKVVLDDRGDVMSRTVLCRRHSFSI